MCMICNVLMKGYFLGVRAVCEVSWMEEHQYHQWCCWTSLDEEPPSNYCVSHMKRSVIPYNIGLVLNICAGRNLGVAFLLLMLFCKVVLLIKWVGVQQGPFTMMHICLGSRISKITLNCYAWRSYWNLDLLSRCIIDNGWDWSKSYKVS